MMDIVHVDIIHVNHSLFLLIRAPVCMYVARLQVSNQARVPILTNFLTVLSLVP